MKKAISSFKRKTSAQLQQHYSDNEPEIKKGNSAIKIEPVQLDNEVLNLSEDDDDSNSKASSAAKSEAKACSSKKQVIKSQNKSTRGRKRAAKK
jgi:hypothetical protein